MSIVRAPRRSRPFTIVYDDVSRDARLSYRARGLLVAILSRPDDWRTDSEQLAREGTEGRTAVRTALRELEDAGYIKRVKRQAERGRWVTDTVVYDEPHTLDLGEPAGHTDDRNPAVGQPTVGELVPIPITETEKTPLPPARSTRTPKRSSGTAGKTDRGPKGTDGYPQHVHHANAAAWCARVARERNLPLTAPELLAWCYRLGQGDPWTGHRAVDEVTTAQLDTADRPLAALLARLRGTQQNPAA